jgi:hypothetical protein
MDALYKKVFDERLDVPFNLEDASVPLESELSKFMPNSVIGKEIEFLIKIFSTWQAAVQNPSSNLIDPYYEFLNYLMTDPIEKSVPNLTVDFVLHGHLLNPRHFIKVLSVMPSFQHELNLGCDE